MCFSIFSVKNFGRLLRVGHSGLFWTILCIFKGSWWGLHSCFSPILTEVHRITSFEFIFVPYLITLQIALRTNLKSRPRFAKSWSLDVWFFKFGSFLFDISFFNFYFFRTWNISWRATLQLMIALSKVSMLMELAIFLGPMWHSGNRDLGTKAAVTESGLGSVIFLPPAK